MSYILDALKKSQAEQNSEGVTLAANTTSSKKPRTRGLLTLVILLVATNVGLLLWVTLQKPQSTVTVDGAPESQPTITAQAPHSAPVETPITTAVLQETAADQITVPEVAESSPPAKQRARPPAAPTIKKVNLSDLPSSEQSKFNSFNYSSHIYTDDPDLCAVVINGQRLSAGDLFEGMEVIAITEEGVVFGSSRTTNQGQREQLHVAISVIEQWEK